MGSRRISAGALAVAAALASAGLARGQGLIVDRRPHIPIARGFEVREVAVDARVRDQVAEVRVSQTFHNPGSTVLESEYLFPLPEEGAIQDLVLMVDGKELPGRLLPKDEARRIFEEIVRTRRDPALLEYMGRGLYRTRVFPIPPGADRKVTMRYTQLLKRDRDVVEFSYPLSTQKFAAKPIGRLSVRVDVEGRDPIKTVYSPSDDVEVRRSGDREATISFVRHDTLPTRDFRLLYTLAEGAVGATVLSYRPESAEDGYVLVLASPRVPRPDERPRPKTVIFVLDRSGSMAGKKIEQARGALKAVLNTLNEGDTFNIVVYDDRVESFKPELQRFDPERRAEAARFVENIREGGSTNIDGALKTALAMVPDADDRKAYILFLTDGLPTAGESREQAIAANVQTANRHCARVFAFGVGHDVNARLLDRLSGSNSGVSEYVTPDQDIEASVGRFASRLTSPALTDLEIELSGTDVNRAYPRDLPDLFDGGQLVWVGRYTRSGETTLRLRGKVGTQRQTFEFPATLARAGDASGRDYVEKLWATRRIGHILDEIDLNGPNRELTDELVALSTRHGILTPYTSFLADENVPLHAQAENLQRARDNLSALGEVTGGYGVAQRGVKQRYARSERAADLSSGLAAPGEPGMMGRGQQGYGGMMGMGGMMHGMAQAKAGRAGADRRSTVLAEAAKPATPAAGAVIPAESGPGGRSDLADASQAIETNVRRVGRKTFYRKGDRWVDAAVTPDDEARASVVEQFGDAYFKLAAEQGAEENQYLSFEEPVVVELRGQVYRIEPARK